MQVMDENDRPTKVIYGDPFSRAARTTMSH
jgi:hypothetical protein